MAKNNIIDCNEILVQKADYRWHGSDKVCKLEICGQTLVPPLFDNAVYLKLDIGEPNSSNFGQATEYYKTSYNLLNSEAQSRAFQRSRLRILPLIVEKDHPLLVNQVIEANLIIVFLIGLFDN